MIRTTRALVVFVLFLTAPLTYIQAAPADYTYISPETLPPQLLPPPPAEGSAGWKQDIATVMAAQKHIGKKDMAALVDEQHLRLSLLTDVIGTNITRERLPKTFALLDHVWKDAGTINEADKQFWHTRRPYLTDPRVKLLVDPINSSPAYPSGHTSESRVTAEVLGMLYPDHLAALRTRADEIAAHRVEAGVHYPADLAGGRMLAMLIVGALLDNDEFQSDLAAAREEIAKNP